MTGSKNRRPNPENDHNSVKKDLDAAVNADDHSGESVDVFRLLSDQSLIGIVIIQDNVFKYANKGAADIFGYSQEEMLSWGPSEFSKIIHPDDISFVMMQARKKQAGDKDVVSHYTYRGLTKSGQICWIELYSRTIKYLGRSADFVTVVNITDRKKTEETLRESRRMLATLMGNLPGMAYRCKNDRDWTMEFVSEGCIHLTGYQPADLIANNKLSFNDMIHPEDREFVWENIQRVLPQRLPYQLSYRIITAAGDEKWVWEQGTGVYSDDDNELLALEGFIIDITDRKHAEDALKKARDELELHLKERTRELEEVNRQKKAMFDLYAIFELSRNFNVLLDYQSLLDSFVRAALGRTGADKAALYLPLQIGKKEFQVARIKGSHPFPKSEITIHPESNFGRYIAGLNRPVAVREIEDKFGASENLAFTSYFPGGLIIPLVFQTELRGVLIISGRDSEKEYGNDEIEFLSILASQTAVSIENVRLYESEKETLEKLQKTQQLLVQSERSAALGELSARIAHEINNPLGIIKNYLFLASRNIDDENRSVEYLKVVKQEIERIAVIVRQLLDFHRPMKIQFDHLNPKDLIEEIISLMGHQLEDSKIKISVTIDDNVPVIMAWPDGLKQVFINLLVNARDAMPDGGEVDFIVVNGDDNTVQFTIEDTGPGIPAEHIPHIFDSFYTTKGERGGTGLGLSVSYRIIKNHNGSIKYYNTDRGGGFKIELPVRQEGIEYDTTV